MEDSPHNNKNKKAKIEERDLVGFKYFKKLAGLIDRLHGHKTARDRAHNRILHYDQHVALILLFLFNPIVSSLRAIVQASELKKVQRTLGCARASLGSLSEANRVFDSELLLGIIAELAAELKPIRHDPRLDDVELRGILTLVDGTLLTALPKLVKAMWLDGDHPAFKLHVHFELLRNVPASIELTDANDSEWRNLGSRLLPGRIYVTDRGYACFKLFNLILKAGSSFVCRVKDNSVYQLIQERAITPQAAAAGVISDRIVYLGCDSADDRVARPLRLVEIQVAPHRKRVHGARGGPEQSETLLIATDLLDLPAEVIALIYQNRWGIEIFFRFFKHVLGCRHLLAHNRNGIEIQTYCAIIACLLIALWTGRKPTLRTYEMVCYYLTGWADEQELDRHIETLKQQEGPQAGEKTSA